MVGNFIVIGCGYKWHESSSTKYMSMRELNTAITWVISFWSRLIGNLTVQINTFLKWSFFTVLQLYYKMLMYWFSDKLDITRMIMVNISKRQQSFPTTWKLSAQGHQWVFNERWWHPHNHKVTTYSKTTFHTDTAK